MTWWNFLRVSRAVRREGAIGAPIASLDVPSPAWQVLSSPTRVATTIPPPHPTALTPRGGRDSRGLLEVSRSSSRGSWLVARDRARHEGPRRARMRSRAAVSRRSSTSDAREKRSSTRAITGWIRPYADAVRARARSKWRGKWRAAPRVREACVLQAEREERRRGVPCGEDGWTCAGRA